jgi:hypothetical protein
MRGFHGLLRENICLFMFLWWISVSVTSLMSQALHLDFLVRKLLSAYEITWCDNSEDWNLNRHCYENLKTYISMKSMGSVKKTFNDSNKLFIYLCYVNKV